ncbi:MAG: PorV/PorQ family protein [Lewinellaceae bacterium]|nr:PorV/PorQ family protein [Saprospiraceae bacterium]MCB9344938.1 PorV/PorQ family protein [Lewinellaceae bacterium]
MKKQLFLSTLLIILALNAILAQKYSNEFLAIGVGGRAHGMSGAQVALTDDITAAYWNPAGLTQIQAPLQAAVMHAEWFGGVGQYDYLSFGKALKGDRGAYLAFSLIRLGVDNIPYTINLVNADGTINYDNVTSFSAADYAVFGSYAQKLKNPHLSVGGSVKVVRRVIGSFGNSWGFGADAGIQYRKGSWMLGAQGRDLTTTFNAWSFNLTDREKAVFDSTNNEIPVSNTEITKPRFMLGAAYKWKINSKTTLMPAIDLEWTTDGQRNVLISSKSLNIDPKIGVEADYKGLVQLRVGVANFQRVKNDFDPNKEHLSLQPNFGIGLHLGRVQLDYALTDIGNVSAVQYSHIFSLRLDFKERSKPTQEQ